jgi:uncharacterized protein (TIGR02246 family)
VKQEKKVKPVLILVLMPVLMCSVASSQTQPQTPHKKSDRMGKLERQVVAFNSAWAEAITKGDAAALERLFADEMIVTSGNGEIRNKAGEIKDAASAPDPNFIWIHPFTTEDVRVRIYGDAAVVTGLAKWTFRYKGRDVNQERRYTHVYVKRHGQWRIVAQQMSSNPYGKSQTSP